MRTCSLLIRTLLIRIFALLFFLVSTNQATEAQGWYQPYPELFPEDEIAGNLYGDNVKMFEGIMQTKDGGFLTWGTQGDGGFPFFPFSDSAPLNILLTKTDLAGNIQWSQWYENEIVLGTSKLSSVTMSPSPDNESYMAFGRIYNSNPTSFGGVQFDETGSILNTFELSEAAIVGGATIPPNSTTRLVNAVPSPIDNTLIILGTSHPPYYSADTDLTYSWVAKVDMAGNVVWGTFLEGGPDDATLLMNAVAVSPNGDVVASGATGPANGQVVFKLDVNGNQMWFNYTDVSSTNRHTDVIAHPNGDFFVKAVQFGWTTDLTRLNTQGDTVWHHIYSAYNNETTVVEFCLLNDGNIGLLEAEYTSEDPISDIYNFRIIDIDHNTISTGTTFLFSYQNFSFFNVGPTNPMNIDMIGTSDGRMALAGLFNQNSLDIAYPYIMKPAANGDIFTVGASGSVFADFDANCVNDVGDIAAPNQVIGLGPYTLLTDDAGLFSVNLLEGDVFEVVNYTVGQYPYDLWQISPGCSESYEADLNNGDVDGLDFAINPLIEDCPRLTVQTMAPFMRPGFSNTAILSYSNVGSAIEDSAYVYVTINPDFGIDSSTHPYVYDSTSNTYEFFVGEIGIFETGSIQFSVYLPADTEVGVVCIESFIVPFDRCNLDIPDWDGSELRITGTCEGDSVLFVMENVGEEDMELARNYAIYADDLLIDGGNVILDAGEIMNVKQFADGLSYRMEADQSPNFPEPSYPEATVEMCNATDGPSTIGLILGTPRDDQAHYRDIECTAVTNSYDPNDKQVVPSGISDQNYVNLNDALEYTIRFQNTGTDTAFNVFILDTLSEFLDLTTFNPGPATHDYDLTMLPNRVIRWDFPNILLPDSTTNLIGSNGALRFTIRAVQDIPQPTAIHNTAAIFFDFNEPIITEDMFITICDECLIQTLATEGVYFDGKVLLEGPYNGAGLMANDLQDLIPMNQPFANFPYMYDGNEQLEQVPLNMVDWVLVEARSGTPATNGDRATTTVETKAAILLNDGSIRGLDGISGVRFVNLAADEPYHFCIRHRNHLDILTATALFPTENMVYDFTTGTSQALGVAQMKWFGTDAKAVMYSGDFNSDGVIQTTDYDVWSSQPAAVEVYDFPDANLDGVIQVSDYDKWFFNKAKVGNVEIGF